MLTHGQEKWFVSISDTVSICKGKGYEDVPQHVWFYVILCHDGVYVTYNEYYVYIVDHMPRIEQMQSESSQLWIFNAEVKVFSTNTRRSYNCPYAQRDSRTHTVFKGYNCEQMCADIFAQINTDTLTHAVEERERKRERDAMLQYCSVASKLSWTAQSSACWFYCMSVTTASGKQFSNNFHNLRDNALTLQVVIKI